MNNFAVLHPLSKLTHRRTTVNLQTITAPLSFGILHYYYKVTRCCCKLVSLCNSIVNTNFILLQAPLFFQILLCHTKIQLYEHFLEQYTFL